MKSEILLRKVGFNIAFEANWQLSPLSVIVGKFLIYP